MTCVVAGVCEKITLAAVFVIGGSSCKVMNVATGRCKMMNAHPVDVLVFLLLACAEPTAGGQENEKDNDRCKDEKKPMRYYRLVEISDGVRHRVRSCFDLWVIEVREEGKRHTAELVRVILRYYKHTSMAYIPVHHT